EDVNLEAVACRSIARCFAQLADFVNTAICGSVDLDYVHRISCSDLYTRIAYAAGLGNWLFARAAVQGHGQDSGHPGLAYPSMPAENVAVCDPALLDGIFEGPGNVLLPDHFRELLRTVFSGENLVAHGRKIT